MKTDSQLKADVVNELQWDPSINAAHVGVTAKDGVVTLSGHLETYVEKFAIERAVQRVEGVRAVAVELDVKLQPGHKRSDSEIAEAAENTLKWHTLVPTERIRVKVEKGWVTLSGEVDWQFQRTSVETAIRPLIGVVGVRNNIGIKPMVAPANIAVRIHDALRRHAEREAAKIEVKVSGSTVTLQGHVDSWADRNVAQGAAYAAPGIGVVINDLKVGLAA